MTTQWHPEPLFYQRLWVELHFCSVLWICNCLHDRKQKKSSQTSSVQCHRCLLRLKTALPWLKRYWQRNSYVACKQKNVFAVVSVGLQLHTHRIVVTLILSHLNSFIQINERGMSTRGEEHQLLPAPCFISLKLTHLHLTVSQTVPLALLLPPATWRCGRRTEGQRVLFQSLLIFQRQITQLADDSGLKPHLTRYAKESYRQHSHTHTHTQSCMITV